MRLRDSRQILAVSLTKLTFISMIKKFLVGAAAAGMLAAPALSFASTYQYVDTTGHIRTETSDNAIDAMLYASNIAATSGVILVDDIRNALPDFYYVPMQ